MVKPGFDDRSSSETNDFALLDELLMYPIHIDTVLCAQNSSTVFDSGSWTKPKTPTR